MLSALRSDHAGETGAVHIYRGILAVSGDPTLRNFAQHHLTTEQRHLQWMSDLLPPEHHSRLLPAWRVAGWLTGALPAFFGASAVYQTIDAVESFVDRHYAQQIQALSARPADRQLRELLQQCRADEIAHRDDARRRACTTGRMGRVWASMVDLGSRAGVALASRL